MSIRFNTVILSPESSCRTINGGFGALEIKFRLRKLGNGEELLEKT